MTTQTTNKCDWRTVRQAAATHPALTEKYIRYLIFHGKENGFNGCFRRAGKKIFIDVNRMEYWIENGGIVD